GVGYGWVYVGLCGVSKILNQQVFHFDITGFDTSIQVAKYESGDEGFYNWHMDNGEKNSRRKISLSVQLSDPADYSGGDLELFYTMQARKADKSRGAAVAFPSFVMHRVTPVTRGVRYSLVVWIAGPRWR
ncbi:MAG: 2OG-Fe(II) oxygenase, partial [Pseudomonadota bacterium]